MLKQRLLTGIALVILVLVVVLWLPQPGFLLCMAAVVLMGAWEWSRLAGLQSRSLRAAYTGLVLLALPLLLAQSMEQRRLVLAAGCLWWVYAYFLVRRYPALGAAWNGRWLPALSGLLVLLPGWSALVALREAPQHAVLLLLLLALVAAADIGAYFSGRAFGRHKLAPQVSPNKTWEGFAGGMLGSAVVALLVVATTGLAGAMSPATVLRVLAVALSVAVISVVGDLFESMIKRRAGVKDSGSLLPGHGGVLDRIDSVTAALPLFAVTVDWFVAG